MFENNDNVKWRLKNRNYCLPKAIVYQKEEDEERRKKKEERRKSVIANAYCSIPQLIFFALDRYGVPTSWISLIRKYYIGLWSKSFSLNALSNWHQHLKGTFAGCTVSIILFLAGMNVIVKYTNTCNAPNFVTSAKTTLPLIRTFMDDIDLMSESVSGVQMLLSRCYTALKWAGMESWCDKSRSIIIINGKTVITDKDSFHPSIPSIHVMPILKYCTTTKPCVIDSIIKEARNVEFPQASIPEKIMQWFEAMAYSRNTKPEFVILASLGVVSSILGTKTRIQIREGSKNE